MVFAHLLYTANEFYLSYFSRYTMTTPWKFLKHLANSHHKLCKVNLVNNFQYQFLFYISLGLVSLYI